MTQTLEKAACMTAKTYPHLKGLAGISDATLEEHFKLYGGYVTNMVSIGEKVKALAAEGKYNTPEYNELKRRIGFELDGVILHELYFENMTPNGGAIPQGSTLYNKLVECFGSYENWEADFKATGMMRGIGWAVLYQCPQSGYLFNVFAGEHENGHPVGAIPVLIMDVWEHAYTMDFKPTGRKGYIDAFFQNICWKTAESRLK